MNVIAEMTRRILRKEELGREDALLLAQQKPSELCAAADKIRRERCGDAFDLCSIINAKSGRCPEDCKYCAQSAHYETDTAYYDLLCEREIVAAALKSADAGVGRFSLVTSGKKLTREEIETLCGVYRAIKRACPKLRLCASHGLLEDDEFVLLKEAGVERYHNNLETSRGFFERICTTHSYEDKLETISRAQNAGLVVCSGGIIGMGEGMAERVDMALELRRLGVRSVPINVLNPLRGTPLQNAPSLSEEEILTTVAVFRFLLPDAAIRLAGGRIRMQNAGRAMLGAGANAAITGDMLTTAGFSYQSDREMIESCGFTAGYLENKC